MGLDTQPSTIKMGEQVLITKIIKELFPEVVNLRRDLHRYPERGWTEYRTSALIAKTLRRLGWDVFLGDEAIERSARMGVPPNSYLKECENRCRDEGVNEHDLQKMAGGMTGVVAEWKSTKPGPVTAFRFDIDSLDINESKEDSHLPLQQGFSSSHEGSMHACGHDGHTAIGLGIARLIAENHQHLNVRGTIRLLFQPAEEGCRGALAMVEKGWLNDVDYFLSGHIGFRSFELGEVILNTTTFLPTTKWDATFIGKAAHAGGEPEQGKNALLAASNAVVNLHAIPRHSMGMSRINVGSLAGGSGRNIIPSHATLELETRGQNEEINQYMSREAVRVIKAAAAMYDVDVELQKVGEAGQAEGDPEWFNQLSQALQTSDLITNIVESLPLGASEDVVTMMKRVQSHGGKATYMMFGSPLPARHHQPLFDFDENVLKVGLEVYAKCLTLVN